MWRYCLEYYEEGNASTTSTWFESDNDRAEYCNNLIPYPTTIIRMWEEEE
jgi:hypothetical protein